MGKESWKEVKNSLSKIDGDFFSENTDNFPRLNPDFLKNPDIYWEQAANYVNYYQKRAYESFRDRNNNLSQEEKDFPIFAASAAYILQLGQQMTIVAPSLRRRPSLSEISGEFSGNQYIFDVSPPYLAPAEERRKAALFLKNYITKMILVLNRRFLQYEDFYFLKDKYGDYVRQIGVLGQPISGIVLISSLRGKIFKEHNR